MFCTQIQKIFKFWADVRLHNCCVTLDRTADFSENSAQSCAQRLEIKKSWKLAARKKNFNKIIARNVEGGRIPPPPPPPPALLGLISILHFHIPIKFFVRKALFPFYISLFNHMFIHKLLKQSQIQFDVGDQKKIIWYYIKNLCLLYTVSSTFKTKTQCNKTISLDYFVLHVY